MDTLPWDTAPDLPWRMFMNPAQQWARMPSFLLGEYVIIACAIVALVHARRHGRAHLLIWLAALVAGTANDMIFMALPLVDNFWQGQASVMLTPRLPLYIPCMYVCFMYYPTMAVRRLSLGRWATASLTGLVACLFYAPYDIVGAKFLWWTWHDTDGPTAQRILGAPVSSSLWVLTFVGAFAYLLDRVLRDTEKVTAAGFTKGLALVAGLSTLLMMVQFQLLKLVDGGGAPGYFTFAIGLTVYGAIATRGLMSPQAQSQGRRASDRLAGSAVAAYFIALTLIMLTFSPESHVSTGLHQLPGPCDETTRDITGVIRRSYLCTTDFDEDYSFACTRAPAAGERWYTLCGRAHTRALAHRAGVASLGAAGLSVFAGLLGPWRRRRHAPATGSAPARY